MSMRRLCFILPFDADDIALEPRTLPAKYPTGKNHSLSHGLSTFARRSLHCFCRRRCPNLSCFQDESDNYSEFHDTPGVTSDALHSKKNGGPRIFSYAELYIGTKGFNEKEVLGSGGFGRVFRAVLPSDGSVVAVKCVAGADQRFEKSFAAELVAVAQLRHRNLVRLRGWCLHEHQLLLVYDYMPNRSLDRLLFAPSTPVLGWDRRRQIVAGLATALFYLHEQLDTQIIHRDVKASNVMLDSGYNARLGDFGLARWIEHCEADHPLKTRTASSRSVSSNNYEFRITDTSRIGGTIGYLPPESFQRRGGATAKSDVFSFGVVVLEVATGRRAVDLAYSDDKIFMLDWVRRLADDGELLSAGDKQLQEGSYPLPGIGRLLHIGLLCSLHDPQSRPTMKWVMETLVSDTVGDLPALPSFHLQPLYISLSSSSSSARTTTGTVYSSNYLTAMGSTVFLTANDENSRSHRKAVNFPNVNTPRTISYKEIVEITNNFSESRMVAELDFGTGYHGLLDNRFHVLVKRLGMKTCPALRLRFSDELSNLGHLRHRHLVQLRGWCTENGEMLVVYDYPSGGVLSRRLFDRQISPAVLTWRQRYRIIKALASAVLYLHEEWEEQVIHRSITSSSVFLDPDMSPRLGCFALAEFLSRNESGGCHAASTGRSSSARGIFGYMSPEYMKTGRATAAADVYSFGVVVLEIVSGRPAVDLRRPEGLLVRRAWGMETRRRPVEEMADERMEGNFEMKELERMVRLGMACTLSKAERRPNMRQIVSILDGNDELLRMMGHMRVGRGREEWVASNAHALTLVRRMKALGIN
ncbi:receptor like protein kinase S.2 [Phalaenopsis equestris]|uniref:receptor like protein kinase S.2 n=1 Tax=Phalaenopsis equestris TaxID=78828 RepID=UPI0009E3C912|nr:receptor like protein kinase S.2 [Phalaenopsis equestris]